MDDVDAPADQVPHPAAGLLARLAEHGPEPGEGLLDGIEVGAVRWEEAQGFIRCFDPHLHGGALGQWEYAVAGILANYLVVRQSFAFSFVS